MAPELKRGEAVCIDYDTYDTPLTCSECGKYIISEVVENYSTFPETLYIPGGCDHFTVLRVSENDFLTLNAEDREELSKKSRIFWETKRGEERYVFVVVSRDLLPSVKRIIEKGKADSEKRIVEEDKEEMVPSL
ncbi:MAG: hypothetical protein QXK42_00570 [Candidatus Korarchaeum sp.]